MISRQFHTTCLDEMSRAHAVDRRAVRPASRFWAALLVLAAVTPVTWAGPEDQNTKFPVSVGIGDTMVPGIADSGGWTTISFEDAKRLGLLDANGDPKTGDNDPKPTGETSLGGTGGGKVKGHIFKKVKLKVQPKKPDGTNNGDPKEVEVDVFVPKKPADQDGATDAEKAKKTGSVITKTGANLASQIKLTDDGPNDQGKDKRGTAWASVAPAPVQQVPAHSDANSGDDHWEECSFPQVVINGHPMQAIVTSCPVTMIPQAWAPFFGINPTRFFQLDSEGQSMLLMAGHIDVMPGDGILGFPTGLATVQLPTLGGGFVTIQNVAVALNPNPAFNRVVLGGNGWVQEYFGSVLNQGPNGQSTCDISPNPPPTLSRTILQWRSLRQHAGMGDLAIVLNPGASGNGMNGPTVESRGTASQGFGIQRIQIQFDGPVTLVNPSGITVVGRITTGGVMGPPVPFQASLIDLLTSDIIDLFFSVGALPDGACYTVTINPGTVAETLTGDLDCSVRSLAGDATGSGDVNLSDALLLRSRVGMPVSPATAAWDLNLSGGAIDPIDMILPKSRIGRTALCP